MMHHYAKLAHDYGSEFFQAALKDLDLYRVDADEAVILESHIHASLRKISTQWQMDVNLEGSPLKSKDKQAIVSRIKTNYDLPVDLNLYRILTQLEQNNHEPLVEQWPLIISVLDDVMH